MKKCIVVSDSFKGTLSSLEICSIARRLIPEYFPGCSVVAIPAADGGEGTVDCMIKALTAEPVALEVSGAYGEPCTAVRCMWWNTERQPSLCATRIGSIGPGPPGIVLLMA